MEHDTYKTTYITMLLEWGKEIGEKEYIQKTTDLLTWQPSMGINDGGRFMLSRKKMALWQEKERKKSKEMNWDLVYLADFVKMAIEN